MLKGVRNINLSLILFTGVNIYKDEDHPFNGSIYFVIYIYFWNAVRFRRI